MLNSSYTHPLPELFIVASSWVLFIIIFIFKWIKCIYIGEKTWTTEFFVILNCSAYMFSLKVQSSCVFFENVILPWLYWHVEHSFHRTFDFCTENKIPNYKRLFSLLFIWYAYLTYFMIGYIYIHVPCFNPCCFRRHKILYDLVGQSSCIHWLQCKNTYLNLTEFL